MNYWELGWFFEDLAGFFLHGGKQPPFPDLIALVSKLQ